MDNPPHRVGFSGDLVCRKTTTDGILVDVKPFPKLLWRLFFARHSTFVEWLHLLPDVSRIKKIVVQQAPIALTETLVFPSSRSGSGLFHHLLRWLNLPVMVADEQWFQKWISEHPDKFARKILKDHFPPEIGFELAYQNEQYAKLALLAFTAVANSEWTGLTLEKNPVVQISTAITSHSIH